MTDAIEGKIPHTLLRHLLSKVTKPGREVLVGPRVGEDAFAVGVGRTVVVGSTDPITFTSEHVGYYAVNVNANDVATMGARPRWFMATALLPPGSEKRLLGELFREIDGACVDLGIRLCGGHTEITSAVSRPVVVGAMLGVVTRRKLVRPERARAGDHILLTKRLALEGTSIIARERKRETERVLGVTRAVSARRLLFSPGISVVKEAMCAVETVPVHAMHDPTEGGLIWGIRELSEAAGIGAEVDLDSVPIYDETRLICDYFKIDPLGLIASGSLLIVASARSASRITGAIRNLGIECTKIGRMCARRIRFLRSGKPVKVPRIRSDEIARVVPGSELRN
jgi:hydrogenase expression/formation protein HypE